MRAKDLPAADRSMCVALIRGINVGGQRKLAMSDVRLLAESLGFTGVQSLMQSGNLLFRSGQRAPAVIEPLFEAAAVKHLRMAVGFFIRTAEEWDEIVDTNPFSAEAKRDPAHLVMMCLKETPGGGHIKALQTSIAGREIVRAAERRLYITYPDGIGTSRLTNAVIEKALGTCGTARNWNTVLKIQAMLARAA
jgi:uncharacterized protein (DUF1697 family)